MYPPLDDFGKAYQESLLKAAGEHPRRSALHNPTLREWALAQLGDALISLGEKIKGQGDCPELAQAKA